MLQLINVNIIKRSHKYQSCIVYLPDIFWFFCLELKRYICGRIDLKITASKNDVIHIYGLYIAADINFLISYVQVVADIIICSVGLLSPCCSQFSITLCFLNNSPIY